MPKEEFIIKPHSILPDKQVVEYYQNGVLAAVIYPHEDGLRVVSKYLEKVYEEDSIVPAAIFKLNP